MNWINPKNQTVCVVSHALLYSMRPFRLKCYEKLFLWDRLNISSVTKIETPNFLICLRINAFHFIPSKARYQCKITWLFFFHLNKQKPIQFQSEFFKFKWTTFLVSILDIAQSDNKRLNFFFNYNIFFVRFDSSISFFPG